MNRRWLLTLMIMWPLFVVAQSIDNGSSAQGPISSSGKQIAGVPTSDLAVSKTKSSSPQAVEIDAPSALRSTAHPAAATGCGPKWMGGCWDYDDPRMSWREALKSKRFLIPTAAFVAASWADRIMSVQVEAHTGCIEGNHNLPSKATYGDMAVDWTKTELPAIGFGLLMAKLKEKPFAFIYSGMATYGVVIHMQGIAAAINCRAPLPPLK